MARHLTRWLPTGAFSLALGVAASTAASSAQAGDTTLKLIMKKFGASADDVTAYSAIFAQVKPLAKPDYPKWSALVDTGKAAADKGDLAGAKAVCKECHTAYRDDYKNKYGSKAP